MSDVVFSLLLSFVITFLSIPPIITIAKLKKLYDLPDERKVHLNPIASLGGVGIFAGFSIAFLVMNSFRNGTEFQAILAATLLMFFVGIKDDILVISPLKKFAAQVIAALLLVFKGGILIKNMHGFMGMGELPWIISVMLTTFTLIVVINSFNLIDGVDGLAGSLGLLAATAMGIYFWAAGEMSYALLAFCLSGSLLAFMFYNFQPARIFMGDTGSLIIGLICSVLVIKFIQVAPGQPEFPLHAAPALGFSILMFPLLDTLRVFALRILNKTSPFVADRNHIHHILLDKGLSHKNVTFTLVASTLVFVGISYLGRGAGNTTLILGLTVCYFLSIRLLSLIPASIDRPISTRQNETGIVQLKPVAKIVLQKKVMAD